MGFCTEWIITKHNRLQLLDEITGKRLILSSLEKKNDQEPDFPVTDVCT